MRLNDYHEATQLGGVWNYVFFLSLWTSTSTIELGFIDVMMFLLLEERKFCFLFIRTFHHIERPLFTFGIISNTPRTEVRKRHQLMFLALCSPFSDLRSAPQRSESYSRSFSESLQRCPTNDTLRLGEFPAGMRQSVTQLSALSRNTPAKLPLVGSLRRRLNHSLNFLLSVQIFLSINLRQFLVDYFLIYLFGHWLDNWD